MRSCFSRVQFCATSWTIACQTPLSMGFSRQQYWSRMPVPVPGDPCNPGMEPRLPALKVDSLVSEPPGKLLLLTVSKSLIGIFFWKCSLHSLGRWWGSHPKQEACFGKHSMCKWVFWNILLFFCMERSGVKMCNEKGKYLMYGAYNIWGTFLQFWLCEVFFTFQILPLLCLLCFLGIHTEGPVI